MKGFPSDPGRIGTALVVVAVWTIPTLVGAAMAVGNFQKAGVDLPYWRAAVWSAPFWYLWALLTPIVFRLAEAYPLDGERWKRSLGVHVGLGTAFAAGHLFVALIGLRLLNPMEPEYAFGTAYVGLLKRYLEYDFLLYGAVLGAGHALAYHRRLRASALRETSLRSRLAEARLKALESQLQPHFLFNTLHSIATLMGEDKAAARRMLARLGDLLRSTLEGEARQEIPLERELENLALYLSIERERFPDRLHVEFDIDDDTLNASVPNLVLQPLVENSIRHGIAPRPSGGRIVVTARRAGDHVRIRVADDGLGLARRSRPLREGVGLRNTRARLEQLYDGRHAFRVEGSEEGGFAVELSFPFRPAGTDAEPTEETGIAMARSGSGSTRGVPAGGRAEA